MSLFQYLEAKRGKTTPSKAPAIITATSPKQIIQKARNDTLLLVTKAVDKPQKPNAIKGIARIAMEWENRKIFLVCAISARPPPKGWSIMVSVASTEPVNRQKPDVLLN